jgi:hypothetical protein
MQEMLLKFLEGRYLVNAPVHECSSLVQKALNEVGLRGVMVKKEVSPNYLLVAYSPSWVGKALEIEFVFKKRERGTEVSVKWPYAEEVLPYDENLVEFNRQEEERRRRTERMIEKFKTLIGAVNVQTS